MSKRLASLAVVGMIVWIAPGYADELKLGNCNWGRANPHERIRDCTKVIEAERVPQQILIRALHGRSEAYSISKDYPRALDDLSRLIGLEPSAGGYIFRASVRMRSVDQKGAFEDYSEAIKLDPKYGISVRGAAYLRIGEIDRAAADFAQAARLEPGIIRHRQQYARLLEFKENFSQAVAEWTEILRVDDSAYYAFIARAGNHMKLGNADAALADCNAFLKHHQTSGAYTARAEVFRLKGDIASARADAEQAVLLADKIVVKSEGDPRFEDYAFSERALAYLAAGRLEDALVDATRAVMRGGTNYGLAARAKILKAMGRSTDAIADLRRILEFSAWNLEARQQLRELGWIDPVR